jgi:hypothetical protein
MWPAATARWQGSETVQPAPEGGDTTHPDQSCQSGGSQRQQGVDAECPAPVEDDGRQAHVPHQPHDEPTFVHDVASSHVSRILISILHRGGLTTQKSDIGYVNVSLWEEE